MNNNNTVNLRERRRKEITFCCPLYRLLEKYGTDGFQWHFVGVKHEPNMNILVAMQILTFMREYSIAGCIESVFLYSPGGSTIVCKVYAVPVLLVLNIVKGDDIWLHIFQARGRCMWIHGTQCTVGDARLPTSGSGVERRRWWRQRWRHGPSKDGGRVDRDVILRATAQPTVSGWLATTTTKKKK